MLASMDKNLEGGVIRTIFPRGSSRGINAYISSDSDGAEWLLIYSYERKQNTDPPLAPGVLPTSPFGGGSHVHVSELGGFEKADIAEVRFFACTSGHERVVHFKTSNPGVCSIAWDGNQNANRPEHWNSGFTELKGHTARLPRSAEEVFHEENGGFWNFPFWKGGSYHWGIKGEDYRWEVDDYRPSDSMREATVHLVWVRMVAGAYASGVPPVTTGTAVAADAAPPLVEMVALLKRELGVKGTNLPDTIDAAIRALGLEGQVRSDMPLIEKAMRCWRLLFVKEEL